VLRDDGSGRKVAFGSNPENLELSLTWRLAAAMLMQAADEAQNASLSD
jgi:hypothetical protein